ncbi:hypothetical protein FB451DRAFT_623912 [Mycena latifolia]|nr:hypothetical protein FB451DRAFT_623912 [Mycena latifolia]
MNGSDWRENTQNEYNTGPSSSRSRSWAGNPQVHDNSWRRSRSWAGVGPQSSWYPHPQQYSVQLPPVGAQSSHPLLLAQTSWNEDAATEPPFVAVNPWGPSRRFGRTKRPVVAQPPLQPHASAHGLLPQAPQIMLPPIPIPSFPWTGQVAGGEAGRSSQNTVQRPPDALGSATNAMVVFNPPNGDEGRRNQQLITAGESVAEEQGAVPHLPQIGPPHPTDSDEDSGSARSSQNLITAGDDAADEQNAVPMFPR